MMSIEIENLPPKWALAPLSLLVYFQEGPGLRKRQFRKRGIPFLNIRTFKTGTVDKSLCQYLDEEEVKNKYSHFLLNEGDIIVSSSGTLGRTTVIKKRDLPLMLNTSVIRFRSLYTDIINREFLHLFLKSSYFYSQIEKYKTGTAQLNYGPSHLKRMQIILPPLNEQKRIVMKIEKLYQRLSTAKEELDKIPPLLRKFRQSVVAKAFSGELTKEWREQQKDLESASKLLERLREERKKKLGEKYKEPKSIDTTDLPELPEGWEWVRLSSIVDKIQYGYTERATDDNVGPKFLRITDITENGSVNWDKVPYCRCDTVDTDKYKLIKGDIVIARTGATTGKNYLVRGCPAAIFASYLVNVRVYQSINPEYIHYFMKSNYYWNQIMTVQKGTAQPGANATILSSLIIPVSSLQEQDQVIQQIIELFTLVDAIEKSIKIAQNYCEKLTQSILAKAFRGELVPQDPKDEPASVLLERIKAAKKKSEVKRIQQ